MVLAVAAVGTVSALEGMAPTPNPAEKERYREMLRLTKAPLIEEYKATMRAEKSALVEQYRAELQTQKTERAQAWCESVQARITNRINMYEEKQNLYVSSHQGVVKRLSTLVGNLKAKGCETAALEQSLLTYEGMVDELAAAFRIFVTSMHGTRSLACGVSEGSFAAQVSEANTEMQAVKLKAQALQTYFRSTLQPELKQSGQACGVAGSLRPTKSVTISPTAVEAE